MAHYNSYSLFDGPPYMDNHGNSVANTCAFATISGGAVFIRYQNQPSSEVIWLVIVTERIASRR